jgi:pimeloyl-ACP methyl ester carboxylesterase
MISSLVMLDVPPGAALESLSGIQSHNPRIYGRLEDGGKTQDVAYLVIHPTNNFMGHYLIEPLRARGRAILALNTRYLGNDSMLLMERAIQDLGAGVRFLRRAGYKKVVLIGNSGGASLVAFYQQQAEKLTVCDTPDGRPIRLSPEDLPPGDAVVLLAAHCGRPFALTDCLDPAVSDEGDSPMTDPAVDMFNPENGPPYIESWLENYRALQLARNERLTDRALRNIADSDSRGHGAVTEPFVIRRTNADPRTLDLTIDANDRATGAIWGDVKRVNFADNGLARFCTARSFLSQWSVRTSRANGPKCLAQTTVPVLNVEYTADQAVFPSNAAAWSAAVGDRAGNVRFRDVGHYPQNDSDVVGRIADLIIHWGG